MAIDLQTVNFDQAEDVTDLKPEPTLAISEIDHEIGSIGGEHKGLLLNLLAATDESQPVSERVFDRLGVDYQQAAWRDYELFWVDDVDLFQQRLEEWSHRMELV